MIAAVTATAAEANAGDARNGHRAAFGGRGGGRPEPGRWSWPFVRDCREPTSIMASDIVWRCAVSRGEQLEHPVKGIATRMVALRYDAGFAVPVLMS